MSIFQNKEEFLERLNKTKDILIPTFNYVSQLDETERDFCEETFYQLSPTFLYMYSIVVNQEVPNGYMEESAQLKMSEDLKMLAGINAVELKRMKPKIETLSEYEKGFYALLETWMLLYFLFLRKETL